MGKTRRQVLVTGGAGFLGSHLCDRLVAGGHDVLCVDNYFTGSKLSVQHLIPSTHFELVRHDVTFPLYVEVDQIYNLACPASPTDANRAPMWPGGIVGSITHTDGYCAAALGRRDAFVGVGIDAEIVGRVGRELGSQLFTIEEIERLRHLPEPQQANMATVMFSAKESFYKAQYSFTNEWLDFTSAAVSIEVDQWHLRLVNSLSPFGRGQQPISGRFAVSGRYVVTAIAIHASQHGANWMPPEADFAAK